jgi:hypothetical protein
VIRPINSKQMIDSESVLTYKIEML